MTAATGSTTMADQVADAFLDGDSTRLVALYRPDALVEVVVPTWRFQLQGREALRQVLDEEEFLPGRRVAWWRRTATEDGLVLELESRAPVHGEERMWLSLHQFRFAPDGVAEQVTYCSGIWSADTIARHAVEAPMLRQR